MSSIQMLLLEEDLLKMKMFEMGGVSLWVKLLVFR